MIIFKLAIERALTQQSRNLMEKVNVSVSVSLERRERKKENCDDPLSGKKTLCHVSCLVHWFKRFLTV